MTKNKVRFLVNTHTHTGVIKIRLFLKALRRLGLAWREADEEAN